MPCTGHVDKRITFFPSLAEHRIFLSLSVPPMAKWLLAADSRDSGRLIAIVGISKLGCVHEWESRADRKSPQECNPTMQYVLGMARQGASAEVATCFYDYLFASDCITRSRFVRHRKFDKNKRHSREACILISVDVDKRQHKVLSLAGECFKCHFCTNVLRRSLVRHTSKHFLLGQGSAGAPNLE